MSVRLTVKQSSEAGGGATEHVLDEATITLGRDKGCQVVLAQQAVSRNHARITQEGNLFFLEDLGSAYGTQVNGKALPKGEKRLLRNGDVIAIAQFDIRFDKVADLPHDVDSQKTSFVARNMVKDVMRGLSGGEERYLRVMNGPREGERLEINDAQEFVIGRDESADMIFQDDLISRRHVKVRRDWSGTHVEDLGSRNGIKVNRKRVSRKMLRDGDELEVGGVRFVYVCPSEAPEEQAEVLAAEVAAVSSAKEEASATNSLPAARERTGSTKRAAAATEKPSEPEAAQAEAPEPEAAAEEPAAAQPEEQPAAQEEPPAEEPVRAPPSRPVRHEEPADEASEKDVKRYIPLVVLGVIGLMALAVLIALFAV
ncbi:FHA domain-containing protein [Vitiosangium sp. GDMCC 1.1324]|uniref:FHA domain-containing protein n=1 Tax=Vitiosangium sp. (strain GDMCC 1.1324) TaxID=2138576 RepID=UPI000D35E90E|nr:FHA domain-containing protein [Vitiosangium sp. GDMCC 1.1324]PTL80492.1 FHA domain-containing protein [Vitiosangium sp. GDMCC 1.1324]